MDLIEFSIFAIGIKAVGFYGQTLAALVAIIVVVMIFRRSA